MRVLKSSGVVELVNAAKVKKLRGNKISLSERTNSGIQ